MTSITVITFLRGLWCMEISGQFTETNLCTRTERIFDQTDGSIPCSRPLTRMLPSSNQILGDTLPLDLDVVFVQAMRLLNEHFSFRSPAWRGQCASARRSSMGRKSQCHGMTIQTAQIAVLCLLNLMLSLTTSEEFKPCDRRLSHMNIAQRNLKVTN